jgi:hypothetical protein
MTTQQPGDTREIRENPGTTEFIPATHDPATTYPADPPRRSWGRRLLTLIGTLGVIAGLVIALKAVDLWPNLRNPFATDTTDRTGPVLLESMRDLSHYVAAEGNFQVLVDLQENNRFLPDFVFNKRTLFVGVGSVDAYVDFSTLGEGAIKISPDGKSVEVTLPAPVLEKPSIDNDRSYVFAEERGVVNRVSDAFGDDPNRQQQLYQLAEDKIAQAATESELRERAEKNTRAMLESLLHQLGYERVTVNFTQP